MTTNRDMLLLPSILLLLLQYLDHSAATTCVCDLSGYYAPSPWGSYDRQGNAKACRRMATLETRVEDVEHRLENLTVPPKEDEAGEQHHAAHSAACDIECHGGKTHWGYGETNGDRCWNRCVPTCGGSSQSPINLRTAASITVDYPQATLVTEGYYVRRRAVLANNGHSAVVKLGVNDPPMAISGMKLPGKYEAAQFHFHWGDDSSRGSEHTVNGRRYPMEMHIVHYNTRYDSIGEAVDKPQGLAVLGFFFYVSPSENLKLDFIIKKLSSVTEAGSETELDQFTMGDLISSFPSNYFRYSGSLTTPPCFESVVWTVLTNPIPISESQLEQFRKLSASDHGHGAHRLADNFRHTLPQGDRNVIYSTVR